jgi:hypothetical protein
MRWGEGFVRVAGDILIEAGVAAWFESLLQSSGFYAGLALRRTFGAGKFEYR